MKEENESALFEKAAAEIGAGKPERGLFAKAYSASLGDEAKTRALYIQYRVEQLKRESANTREDASLAHSKPEARHNTDADTPGRSASTGQSGEGASLLLRLIEFLRQRLPTVIRVCLAVLAVLVVLDALPFLVDKHHAHTKYEKFPGFWAVFGFFGCVFLILASKAFGQLGIMQREDY
ncbi:MAG: hypothetical protein FJ399_11505 [Verrucomicrobia bacterium]|nr:hypothetical protein [Verrucomicrobiota bacterium]